MSHETDLATTPTPAVAPVESGDHAREGATVALPGKTEAIFPTQPQGLAPNAAPMNATLWGVPLPTFISNPVQRLGKWGAGLRKTAIEKTPRPIVNYSSNIVGAGQIVAESLMFQSSGIQLDDKAARGNPLEYLKAMGKNVVKGLTGNLKKSKIALKGNPLELDFYKALPGEIKESFALLRDVEKATLRDRTLTAPMINKWSARSAMAGLVAMSISAVMPDGKDTVEETKNNLDQAHHNPVGYVAKRLYQALNPLEWPKHKRQFTGLGLFIGGVFSFVSGFRQVEGKFGGIDPVTLLKVEQKYIKNGWHMAGGLITAMGGGQLLLEIDNDQAWRNFGVNQMMRLFTLPPSIMKRFQSHEQGSGWYFGAQAVFQVKNTFAALVGGAKKNKDGTVVDFDAMRKEADAHLKTAAVTDAEHEVHDKKFEAKDGLIPTIPTNSITSAQPTQRMLPDAIQQAVSA